MNFALRGKYFRILVAATVALAAVSALGGTPRAFAAGPIVVTPASSDWVFLNDNNTTGDWTAGFQNGPGTPPAGVGSVYVTLSSSASGITFATQKYQGTALADIQALSYSTYTNLSPAAMSFQINYDPDVTTGSGEPWYGRLVYEPYMNGTVTNGTWQTWDMIAGGAGKWWASGSPVNGTCPQASPCTWSALIAAFPHIGIRNDASSAIQFKAGSNWNGFAGNVDNLTFETGGVTDVYDFELPSTVYVDDDFTSGSAGGHVWGADAFNTIQGGIDAVAAGGTVNVFPGTYNQDEANDRNPDTGGSGANDFNIFVGTPNITIQGVHANGTPINAYGAVAAQVIAKRALPTFGEDAIFVQASGVTISGLEVSGWSSENNKTIEVVGDDFTLKASKLHGMDGAAALYFDDRHYDAGTDTSFLQSYTIDSNYLDGGGLYAAGIRISSGAGWSGPVANRVITGNTFANLSDGIEFVGPQADPWDMYPVGAATITGNTFTTADRRHVIAWGEYEGGLGYGDIDWQAILDNNTFDKSVTVWTSGGAIRTWDCAGCGSVGDIVNIAGIYSSIQRYAIDRVAQAGDTIDIGAGTYAEDLTVDVPVTLEGAGQASTTIIPSVSQPNPCEGSSLCGSATAASNIILVQANNVTIHDLTLDGDNPGLTSGIVRQAADVDARNGIVTNYMAGSYGGLEVYNTTVKNIYLRGMYQATEGTFNFHDNTVTNVQGDAYSIAMFAYYGPGVMQNNTVSHANDAISANHSRGIQFLNNTVTNSASGVHTDNGGETGWTGSADLIEGNTISDCSTDGYGIFVFAPYLPITVNNNTVTGCTIGLSAWGSNAAVTTQFTNNTVTGPSKAAGSVGAYVTTDLIGYGYADVAAEFTNNIITNNETGVFLTADEQSWNPLPWVSKTVTATFHDNQITGNTKGVDQGTTGTIVNDFTHNWWGAELGPDAPDNTYGTGDSVVTGIVYSPWCADQACSTFLPPFGTTTTITSDSPDPSVLGQDVTLNFTVADNVAGAPVPVGTVDITDGLTVLCNDVALDGTGAGTCTAAISQPDARTLTATFTPTDAALFAGSSDTELHTVNAIPVITEGASVDVDMSRNGDPIPFALTLHATDANAGDTLTWQILTNAAHGTASVSVPDTGAAMDINYTPNTDYGGLDSFVVGVSDGHGGSDSIYVHVFVSPSNNPPVITEGSTVTVNMSVNGSPTPFSLTLNATDADNDTLTWSILTDASHGAASASGTGNSVSVGYTPEANYVGADSFVVKVADAYDSDTITVNVNVNPLTFTAIPNKLFDGWVLESSEFSGTGGSMNAVATTFNLGDDAADRQYRTILSFNTSGLDDSAVITGITLKFKKAGLVGANPFLSLGKIKVDIKNGTFGLAALQLPDFQAAATTKGAMTIQNAPVNGWYSGTLGAAADALIKKAGITQFRLRFAKDDNDNHKADYLKFYTANSAPASQPLLVIQYYIPVP